MESIGQCAFSGCGSLESITIPKNVMDIMDRPFEYCGSLASITVAAENTMYKDIGGVLFNKAGTALICYPAGKAEASYSIPDNVTSIGEYAFYRCNSLSNILIPGSVTNIGDRAFMDCFGLISITISNNVTSIGDWAFYSFGTVYCEAENKPSGWDSDWNHFNSPVIWNCELSLDKIYVVSFIKTTNSIENPNSLPIISAPYREGYTFGGWLSVVDGLTYDAADIGLVPDGKLDALWT